MVPPFTQMIVPAMGVPPGAENLNSMYNAKWSTVLGGVEFMVPLRPLPLAIQLGTHYWIGTKYRGEGFWNLRPGLSQNPSFKHKADGHGADLDARLVLRITEGLQATVGWTAMWAQAKDGTDETFLSGGGSATVNLNNVDLRSNYYYVGLGYRW